MSDRPFSPAGAEIMAQAFDAYGDWLSKYSEELEPVEPTQLPVAYGYWCEGIDIDTVVLMVS